MRLDRGPNFLHSVFLMRDANVGEVPGERWLASLEIIQAVGSHVLGRLFSVHVDAFLDLGKSRLNYNMLNDSFFCAISVCFKSISFN